MNLSNLTILQLKNLCNSLNIKLKSNLKKSQIIDIILLLSNPRVNTPILKIKKN
jgi:hypothetical protein